MGSEEKNTIETQIRSACPQEAIGYRLVVLTTTPTVYPIRALHGRDYYIVNPELVEFPTGTPVGLHQLQFVDAGGSTIPLSRQIKVRIAAEEQTEQASDEDEPEGQEPELSSAPGATSSRHEDAGCTLTSITPGSGVIASTRRRGSRGGG